MEIRVLKYFLTVAREESINKASLVLHITQPTLSRQLAQLEEELGVTLFIRGPKKVTLTEEGILLRRRAEEIVSLVDKTEEELLTNDEHIEGTISIGTGEFKSVKVLAKIIKDFNKQFPLVKFDIFTADADVVKEQMEKGLIDIGLLLEPVDKDKFDYIRLKEKESWIVYMRSDDELAKKDSISADDLKDKNLIMPRRLQVRNEINSWFNNKIDDSQIFITSNLSTNASIMVKAGLGYTISIDGSMVFLDESQITYRYLNPSLETRCVIAWKKQQPFARASEKFIEYIQYLKSIGNI